MDEMTVADKYSQELYHHGVVGMKWGVRRYQNKDGSLTNAGKKRYRSTNDVKSMSDDELRSKINRMNLEKRYVDLSKNRNSRTSKFLNTSSKIASASSSAGKITNNSYQLKDRNNKNAKLAGQSIDTVSKGLSTAKKINNLVEDRKAIKKSKSRLESMSDKELAEIVNRMDLERQYSSLKSETVSRGKLDVDKVLDIAGDLLAIGASATAIAVSIHNLTK